MIHQLCSLFDVKARVFWTPFCSSHLEVAIRGVQGAAMNEQERGKSALVDHPQDFTLYHLGTFDDELGQVSMFPQPVNLGLVVSLVAKLKESFVNHKGGTV